MPLLLLLILVLNLSCGGAIDPNSNLDSLRDSGATETDTENILYKTDWRVTFRETGGPTDANQPSCSPFHSTEYDGVHSCRILWGCATPDGAFLTTNGNMLIVLDADTSADFNRKLAQINFNAIAATYPSNPTRPDNTRLSLTLQRNGQIVRTTFPAHSPSGLPRDLSAAMVMAASQNFLIGVGFTP